jgi:MFS family permease
MTTIWNLAYTFMIRSVWPGLGLLGESYLLFSLGTLQPLLATVGVVPMVMPLMMGVIIGMIGFGLAGACGVGRRWGSIGTATLMWMGSLGMFLTSLLVEAADTVASNSTASTNVVVSNAIFGVSLCILGLGVGGEYPMAAASASEQQHTTTPDGDAYEEDASSSKKSTTGRQVQLVFSMQGMGILLHCGMLWGLLLLLGEDTEESLVLVWRILYFVGVVLLGSVLLTRILHLKESPAWEADQKRAAEMVALENADQKQLGNISPSSNSTIPSKKDSPKIATAANMHVPYPMSNHVSSLSLPSVAVAQDEETMYHIHVEERLQDNSNSHQWRLAWKLYGARLVGVSLSWFFWDIAFYGNKLFQSAFLQALTAGDETTTLTAGAGAATLNAAFAAAGYLTAAAIMDRIGQWRLQLIGFVITGLLFLSTGLLLDRLVDGAKVYLVTLYLGTSYFGQVGPNATTFALPAKVMPTAWRTMGHGIAAACGKFGALAATLIFRTSSSDAANLFLWSGYASLLGAVVTYWLVPYEKTTPNTLNGQDEDGDGLDVNWHKAASGQPFAVPVDSVYERLSAQRRKVQANGNYLTSDLHDAVDFD